MADRELRVNEKNGTFIQHRFTGATGSIVGKDANGYYIRWIANAKSRFLPFNQANEYVVIQ